MVKGARALTNYEWGKIQSLYEGGEVLRKISKAYNICLSTLQNRAERGNWERNKNAPEVAEIVNHYAEIKDQFQKISDKIPEEHLELVKEQLKIEFDGIAEMSKAINNLSKGFLTAHSLILKSAIDKFRRGEIKETELSRIVQAQGGTYANVVTLMGMSKEKQAQTNIQVNNNTESTAVNITLQAE